MIKIYSAIGPAHPSIRDRIVDFRHRSPDDGTDFSGREHMRQIAQYWGLRAGKSQLDIFERDRRVALS